MNCPIQFELAMRKLPALAKAMSAAPITAAPSPTTCSLTGSVAPSRSSQSSKVSLDDRLKIMAWSGLEENQATDVDDKMSLLRASVRNQVQSCFDNELSPATLASYQSSLRAAIKSMI